MARPWLATEPDKQTMDTGRVAALAAARSLDQAHRRTTAMPALLPAPAPSSARAVALPDLHEEARAYLEASRAPSPVRAYACDWRSFTAWCAEHGLSALPAEPATIVLYMTDLARTAK